MKLGKGLLFYVVYTYIYYRDNCNVIIKNINLEKNITMKIVDDSFTNTEVTIVATYLSNEENL